MKLGTKIGLGLFTLLMVVVAVRLWPQRQWQELAAGVATNAPANDIISRGEYLARVGDCVACHTATGGREFVGQRPMATPFGALYVPNITPDDDLVSCL